MDRVQQNNTLHKMEQRESLQRRKEAARLRLEDLAKERQEAAKV